MTPHQLTGTPLGPLLGLLRRNGVSPSARHAGRLLPVIWVAGWATLWGRMERERYGARLAAAAAPDDPLIVVGHWRTGSTFLHQLLALDPALAAPTTLQCSLPEGFLVAARYVEPVMRRTLAPTRPMDGVRLAPEEPQEDEFALLRMTGDSPLERLIFPRNSRYFLLEAGPRLLRGDPARWGEALLGFLARVSLAAGGRRIVLKNPFHSARIPRLGELFPRARYVRIMRDPRAVIPSTRHLWTVLGDGNALRREWRPPALAEVVEGYRRLAGALEEGLAPVPRERRCDVRFEDLEADPLRALRGIYEQLSLPFDPEHERRVRTFLAGVSSYRKNRYALHADEERLIAEALAPEIARHGRRG